MLAPASTWRGETGHVLEHVPLAGQHARVLITPARGTDDDSAAAAARAAASSTPRGASRCARRARRRASTSRGCWTPRASAPACTTSATTGFREGLRRPAALARRRGAADDARPGRRAHPHRRAARDAAAAGGAPAGAPRGRRGGDRPRRCSCSGCRAPAPPCSTGCSRPTRRCARPRRGRSAGRSRRRWPTTRARIAAMDKDFDALPPHRAGHRRASTRWARGCRRSASRCRRRSSRRTSS